MGARLRASEIPTHGRQVISGVTYQLAGLRQNASSLADRSTDNVSDGGSHNKEHPGSVALSKAIGATWYVGKFDGPCKYYAKVQMHEFVCLLKFRCET